MADDVLKINNCIAERKGKTSPAAMKDVAFIVIHASATPRDHTAASVDAGHKAKGWACCGYHYVIESNGSIHQYRAHTEAGGHSNQKFERKGKDGKTSEHEYNSHGIGICLMGGEDGKEGLDANYTKEQQKSLKELVVKLQKDFPNTEVLGHRDCGAKKACPCFNVANWYAAEIAGEKKSEPEKKPQKPAEKITVKKETPKAATPAAEKKKPVEMAEPKSASPAGDKIDTPEQKPRFVPSKGPWAPLRRSVSDSSEFQDVMEQLRRQLMGEKAAQLATAEPSGSAEEAPLPLQLPMEKNPAFPQGRSTSNIATTPEENVKKR